MSESPKQKSDPLNRLRIDADSLARAVETFEQRPISVTPDEERPKKLAAIQLTTTYNILALIREDLVRLAQERTQATEEKWKSLKQWDPSVPEGTLTEDVFVARMRQHTRNLVTEVEKIERALPQQQQELLSPAINQVHTLLNALREILLQFVRCIAQQNPDDQLLTYAGKHDGIATVLRKDK